MIYELLGHGEANAISCKDLQKLLNMDARAVTTQIEKERRQGKPICASCNHKHAGYYLATTRGMLEDYCKALLHREAEISKTRRALIELATALPLAETDNPQ